MPQDSAPTGAGPGRGVDLDDARDGAVDGAARRERRYRNTGDELSEAIANNVRNRRKEKGWSQAALAEHAGVSRGMVLHIEMQRIKPTVALLSKIADALGVSIAGLIDLGETPAIRVVRAHERTALWRSDGGGQGEVLVGTDAPLHAEAWNWVLAPGDVHVGSPHSPGTNELVYVIEGELTVTVKQESVTLFAGDASVFPGDREHRYLNPSSGGKSRFVMIVAQP
ncbi:MAG: helix-turn-helix domain-containing protein [Acidimicrobiales bacterium]